MRVGPKLITLLAVAVTGATAVAASIDTKTEHLGFRLGSMRRDLTQPVLKENHGTHQLKIVKRAPEMQDPEVAWLSLQPPPGATFGGVKVDAITVGYIMERLCWISMEFEHAPYSAYKDAIATLLEGLNQKYGPPSADPSKRGNGPLGRHLAWEGDDIVLRFDEFPGSAGGLALMPTEKLGITLGSKSALKQAEEDALQKFSEAHARVRQKAKAIEDDL